MAHITRELLRKRAEHNEGVISTLEEISLHQEELTEINEVLGMTCRKLKILYFQNNIIGKMENLHHMKDLQYLNMALNNVAKIEGLQNCEFLRKLDLTVNFVDFDTLKESIEHLATITTLEELYMMGNPAQAKWEQKFSLYLVAKLPQLKTLDGTEITRTMQISAKQQLAALEVNSFSEYFIEFLPAFRMNWRDSQLRSVNRNTTNY
jgi:protein TilB